MLFETVCGDPWPEIHGTLTGATARPAHPDLAVPPDGYVAEQYIIDGTARGQRYRTVLQILRPEGAGDESGVVIVEPWHRAGYWTIYSKIQRFVVRNHHTAAIVLANHLVLETRIKPQNPALYESFDLPDFDVSDSEVIAQVGALIRAGAVPGVMPRSMILAGQSTEGFWTRRYMAQEHAHARLDGHPIFDGYFPAQSALSSVRGVAADVDVPVLELQGEGEVIRYFGRSRDAVLHRKEDDQYYRLYEVPGMPHVCTRNGANAHRAAELTCPHSNWSNFPVFEVFHAAMDNLIRWVRDDVAAPSAPWIETSDAGRVIVRDEHGNARGGFRTSLVEVPDRTVHATSGPYPEDEDGSRCDFFAWDEYFSALKLKDFYGSHDEYVAQVNQCLDRLVSEHWMLTEDAVDLRDEAVRDAALWE